MLMLSRVTTFANRNLVSTVKGLREEYDVLKAQSVKDKEEFKELLAAYNQLKTEAEAMAQSLKTADEAKAQEIQALQASHAEALERKAGEIQTLTARVVVKEKRLQALSTDLRVQKQRYTRE